MYQIMQSSGPRLGRSNAQANPVSPLLWSVRMCKAWLRAGTCHSPSAPDKPSSKEKGRA